MPNLTGTVGRGGNNRVHDVAVIQAGLRNARLPGAGGDFWKGHIDGRKSPALEEAICAFQAAARVPVNGRIGQSGTDTNRLEGAVPYSHKGMRAVVGTAAVWRTSGRAKRFAEVAKAAENAPFPKAERAALGAIAKRCAQSFGLGVELTEAAVTADGRFRARLGVPDLEWIDGGGTRFHKGGSVPPEVMRGVARAAQGNPTWRAEPQPRDGALIELLSMRVYQPLHGAPVPTTDDYDTFGITQRPNDQISRACVAGCARLVAAGGVDAGDKDFEAMVEVLEQTASEAAGKIILAQQAPGRSRQVTPSRPLTAGEISLATSIFGGQIDYSTVKIYQGKYEFWQGDNVTMAPNGNIYFGPNAPYSPDLSAGGLGLQGHFIHEMTHVWQVHTLGMNLLELFIRRNLIQGSYSYLPLIPNQPFVDYGIEQQANIVRDYFLLNNGQSIANAPGIHTYQALIPFVSLSRPVPRPIPGP